ncbi:hypothetical protein [Pseudomonas fluorescens]|uniref:hypothetical protein n=1 Tax=Pseudomonas fluorescens TaxID=294 RepID=UPI0009BD3749|nr:hypothetical protein [Pseudomonas fluorescens]
MQTPSASTDESDPAATAAIRHQALLEEYSRLLAKLRSIPAVASALTDTLIRPQPFAPLVLAAGKQPTAPDKPGLLHPDGQCSLASMALYYGMPPWDPADPAQHHAALHALDEKRARHALQLESGVDIDLLNGTTTAAERKSLRDQKRLPSAESASFATGLERLTAAKIKQAVRDFLPATETSLLSHLAKTLPAETTLANIRQTPTVYLEKILQSSEASRLAQALLVALDWFGKAAEEQASPLVRNKLLSRAIRVWGQRAADAAQAIAGYAWQQPCHYGKSYQTIWREFEDHLLQSNRAATASEAVLLASVYRCEFPNDFHRADIPADLPYKSSVIWVNFVHGLNLAEVIEPERVAHMTFQQLVDFPLEESTVASEQELALIAWCRIPPAVDWAVATGVLPPHTDTQYSDEQQEQALQALDTHINKLTEALKQMDVDSPKRADIADREISKVFGYLYFSRDSRKLARYVEPASGGGFRQVPDVRQHRVSLQEVYMWKGHKGRTWSISRPNSETLTTGTLRINADGSLHTTASWLAPMLLTKTLPDVNDLFQTEYTRYLTATKAAYQTLLGEMFLRLPHDARQAIEYGQTRLYTLRDSTTGLESGQEKPSLTLPLRLRMGFILRLDYRGKTSWYECLPRAGIIRERNDMTTALLDGRITSENWRTGRGSVNVDVRRGTSVPFDRDAHEKGDVPKKDASCIAIIEQLGETFTGAPAADAPALISSAGSSKLATYIAQSFFYYNEAMLYAHARQQTELEKREDGPSLFEKLLKFLPFFGNLDDLDSDNPNKRHAAIFGIVTDILSFGMPVGKFVSGTVKLASTALRLGYKQVLPRFSNLSAKLLLASAKEFIPFNGLPQLTKGVLVGLYALNKSLLKLAIKKIEKLAARTGTYDIINGLPQITQPGRYKTLGGFNELGSSRGVDDIPIRRAAGAPQRDYRMVDPLTNKPYGPSLNDKNYRFSIGSSAYRSVAVTDQHVTVKISEQTSVSEVLEVDGRTTMFIDDVAYQLDANTLRRATHIDTSERFIAVPCRVKRAPGQSCETRLVTRDPAPTPAVGSYDESKGWATWFGDSLYTRPKGHAPMSANAFDSISRLNGLMVFRKGLYGRLQINVFQQQDFHLFEVGAVIVEAIDGSKHYVFTRLNADDFYVANLLPGKSLQDNLVFLKASTLSDVERRELITVYTGSLNANNMARIYGIEAVERAMQTMEQIAIPIGGHAIPPNTLTKLKVDTSPGEAVLFDHSTRMIVSRRAKGVTSWSRSQNAPADFRQRAADIFDTLRAGKPIPKDLRHFYPVFERILHSDLVTDQVIARVQNLLPPSQYTGKARNIAYADIVKADGEREVYVSVSGKYDMTSELPLFSPPFANESVKVGKNTTYFNVDAGRRFPETSLNVSGDGRLLAIPHTIKNIENYKPTMTTRPTSLDSEAKLIKVLREKYPDPATITSIEVVTTLPPCTSCSVVVKEFGFNGSADGLKVMWE